MVDAEAEAAAGRIHPMIYVDDPDFTLHVGDVRDVLAGLPAGSVNCVVTSPPYWGLRDYGTGLWEGGDPDCDHTAVRRGHGDEKQATSAGISRDRISGEDCRACGAVRIDRQLGLEATPDEYVANMVAVFREVRRVLRADGTCWLNLGDSYAGGGGTAAAWSTELKQTKKRAGAARLPQRDSSGLKPKDLVGIPWRVAFALQADGWYLRSDIIWGKPNPMPESVTDRPTKSHEYVFLLTRSPRYWFDQEAVRERYDSANMRNGFRGEYDGPSAYVGQQGPQNNSAKGPDGRKATRVVGADGSIQHRDGERWPNGGRNVRSVWEIATQPYSEAHFATFPEELVRRCLLAGCPEFVCGTCGKPRERLVETEFVQHRKGGKWQERQQDERGSGRSTAYSANGTGRNETSTVGWSDCGHNNWTAGTVLDPFMGSGTTALVARRHGRRAVGIELNADYAALAARRLQQLSLLA